MDYQVPKQLYLRACFKLHVGLPAGYASRIILVLAATVSRSFRELSDCVCVCAINTVHCLLPSMPAFRALRQAIQSNTLQHRPVQWSMCQNACVLCCAGWIV